MRLREALKLKKGAMITEKRTGNRLYVNGTIVVPKPNQPKVPNYVLISAMNFLDANPKLWHYTTVKRGYR